MKPIDDRNEAHRPVMKPIDHLSLTFSHKINSTYGTGLRHSSLYTT